jgi:hypothetical protein
MTLTTYVTLRNGLKNGDKQSAPLIQARACTSETANFLEDLPLNTGKLFRLFVFHAIQEQLALYYGNLPVDLSRISILGKFQPTGLYNHTDKSGQLPKTEPLRLRYSSLQRL